jgi:hypothetical protein
MLWIYIGLAVFLLWFGYSLWEGYPTSSMETDLVRQPPTPIAAVAAGAVVKIAGRVRRVGPAVVSPVSGRSGVYFKIALMPRHNRSDWESGCHERASTDFLVEDGTGRALIRAADAVFHISPDYFSGSLETGITLTQTNPLAPPIDPMTIAAPGAVADIERIFGIVYAHEQQKGAEEILEDGHQVAVLGVARWEDDPDPSSSAGGYREAPRRLLIEPDPKRRSHVVVTDGVLQLFEAVVNPPAPLPEPGEVPRLTGWRLWRSPRKPK